MAGGAAASWLCSVQCPRTHPRLQLNIGLFAFNLLLPAYPLDGGRILADLLLLCGVRAPTAAKVTAVLATLLGGGIVAFGVWRTIVGSVAACLTIFVGIWCLFATLQLWGHIRAGTVEQHPMFKPAGSGAGAAAPSAQLPAVGSGTGYSRYDGDSAI